jgi:hypothetical protein
MMTHLSSAVWRKSTYSGSGNCVEVAFVDDVIAVRSSKNLSGPVIFFAEAEWQAFRAGVREGDFDFS